VHLPQQGSIFNIWHPSGYLFYFRDLASARPSSISTVLYRCALEGQLVGRLHASRIERAIPSRGCDEETPQ
jgi:hypothetical protein